MGDVTCTEDWGEVRESKLCVFCVCYEFYIILYLTIIVCMVLDAENNVPTNTIRGTILVLW